MKHTENSSVYLNYNLCLEQQVFLGLELPDHLLHPGADLLAYPVVVVVYSALAACDAPHERVRVLLDLGERAAEVLGEGLVVALAVGDAGQLVVAPVRDRRFADVLGLAKGANKRFFVARIR